MKLRRELGFLKALGAMSLGEVVTSPEFIGAALIGAGGGSALLHITTVGGRRGVASDYLLLLGPLVGVVLAALALVIALMSDSYLRLLRSGDGGVLSFVRPFIVTVGVQVAALIGGVAYRATATRMGHTGENAAFVLLSFVFVFGALDVVAITRNLFAHALLRERLSVVEESEAGGAVAPLQQRRPAR